MKAFFIDLFTYHNYYNQKLTEQLAAHENRLPGKTIPLFSHSINAHQIWNARIIKNEPLGVHQIHSLDECSRIDHENYHDTLRIVNERELEEIISYSNTKGDEFTNSIQQILFHIANHFSHHRGQIIADFRQSGIEPIKTDYIFYKREIN